MKFGGSLVEAVEGDRTLHVTNASVLFQCEVAGELWPVNRTPLNIVSITMPPRRATVPEESVPPPSRQPSPPVIDDIEEVSYPSSHFFINRTLTFSDAFL